MTDAIYLYSLSCVQAKNDHYEMVLEFIKHISYNGILIF